MKQRYPPKASRTYPELQEKDALVPTGYCPFTGDLSSVTLPFVSPPLILGQPCFTKCKTFIKSFSCLFPSSDMAPKSKQFRENEVNFFFVSILFSHVTCCKTSESQKTNSLEKMNRKFLFCYRPHAKDGEGTVFRGVYLSTGSTPYPGLRSQVVFWGREGVPQSGLRRGEPPTPPLPHQNWDRVPHPFLCLSLPSPGVLLPLHPFPSPPSRTHHGQDTARAVCLLRFSRRRTFLFTIRFYLFTCCLLRT